jgi:DHA2 family multidrug resistance protein
VDTRKLLFAGVVLSAGAMYLLSRLSLDVGFWNFWWPLMLQGAALGLIFVPLTTVTHDPIPRERLGNATSIFNVMRNIGASIGISIVQALQYRALQKHINTLGKFVSPSNLTAQTMIGGLKQKFMSQGADVSTATTRAYEAVWGMLNQQAAMLSYNDVFFILAIIFLMMAPLILLMRRAKRAGAVMAH